MQHAVAEDMPALTDAEFRTFAVEDLDQRTPMHGSSDIAAVSGGTSIPGYPLSAEELSLIMASPEPLAEFSRTSFEADYPVDQLRPPFRLRLMGWIKQRSSDFNLFKLFNSDDSQPGVRLDVDTDEEELVLQYRIGF